MVAKPSGTRMPALGKLAEKLAQRGVLAADAVNIRHAKLTEREYVTTLYHFYPLITR